MHADPFFSLFFSGGFQIISVVLIAGAAVFVVMRHQNSTSMNTLLAVGLTTAALFANAIRYSGCHSNITEANFSPKLL
jgi:hypothetical protein